MSFEIVEHTADIGLRAWADTWAELVEQASLGVVAIYMDNSQAQPAEAIPVAVNGEDRESLLVNWLNEIVYLLDGRSLAVHSIVVQEAGDDMLRGTVHAEPRSERHPVRLIVKGVTWHQLTVEHGNGGWRCVVYLDV